MAIQSSQPSPPASDSQRETRPWLGRLLAAKPRVLAYFLQTPSFSVAFPPLLVLSVVLFTRSFWTNYIFDEQEALLANPYVNGGELAFWDVFSRDFWGLPPTGSIGSYRPLPNIIWRLLWAIRQHAWLPHWFNVVLHAANGALLVAVAYRWFGEKRVAWFCGLAFVSSAVITEAVCGVVGIADVLSGHFILLTLYSLRLAPLWLFGVTLGALFLGLLSKESTLTATPMVALAALICSPLERPEKPRRFARACGVALGAVGAVVAYTYFRRHFFPVALPVELQSPLPDGEPFVRRLLHDFLRWFQQPSLPKDPINNPLVGADTAHRVSGALRVYFRGLMQVVFPWTLSGDYSYPQEPIPTKLLTWQSVLGGMAMVLPPLVGVGFWARSLWKEYQWRWLCRQGAEGAQSANPGPTVRAWAVAALAFIWIPVTYFPHSNIPIVLPTVRAERFWYIPVIASSLLIGWVCAWAFRRFGRSHRQLSLSLIVAFFVFQGGKARLHAMDYRSDLIFWRATADAVPNSAKAHLNYGVMLGARGRLEERLVANRRSVELAPTWAMAHIYYGDTLCRLHRAEDAWPSYAEGFKLGPNQQALIALALQCLWDEKGVEKHREELLAFVPQHKGTWLAYLASDIVHNGATHGGVDPKYRPRGYNDGIKQNKKKKQSSAQTESTDEAFAVATLGASEASAVASEEIAITPAASSSSVPPAASSSGSSEVGKP